ncbi:uncharacterized protein LOC111101475 isoform X2 [Crassostrea virginica]
MIRCDVVLLVLILDINSSVFSRKYLHCKTGQHGLNCQHKCTYPYYGKRCIYKCNCPNQYCHYERGCLLPGYTGPFCESQCSYPKFGYGCQMLCYCPKQRCNFSSGCQMEKNSMVDKIISTLSSIESIKVTTHVTVPLSPDFVTNKSTVVSEVETLNTDKMKQNNNRYVQDPSNNHEWVKISLVVFGVALFVTIIMNIVISFARSCSIEQVQR